MPRRKATEVNDGGGRRGEIVRAAAKLFRLKGFHGTSIIEIANEVGLPKGSIYNYVESKEELLFEIITLGIQANLPKLRAIAKSDEEPEEKFRQIAYRNALDMATYHEYISIFYQDRNSLSSDHHDQYVGCRKEIEEYFKRILREGMKKGVFRRTNVTLLAFAVLGMCNWITQWYRPDGKLSAEKIAEFFTETALHMVRS
jgi:AcrR family transcriptional regulator